MREVDNGRVADATGLSQAEPCGLGPSGFDPSREDTWPDLTLHEMNEAFDELHGCMIRRPSDICEVRKEYLAVALAALDKLILSERGRDVAAQEVANWWQSQSDRAIAYQAASEAFRIARDSDGSPKGGDGEAGSVHDSAGRKASPESAQP